MNFPTHVMRRHANYAVKLYEPNDRQITFVYELLGTLKHWFYMKEEEYQHEFCLLTTYDKIVLAKSIKKIEEYLEVYWDKERFQRLGLI